MTERRVNACVNDPDEQPFSDDALPALADWLKRSTTPAQKLALVKLLLD